jgi:hypothetical protein
MELAFRIVKNTLWLSSWSSTRFLRRSTTTCKWGFLLVVLTVYIHNDGIPVCLSKTHPFPRWCHHLRLLKGIYKNKWDFSSALSEAYCGFNMEFHPLRLRWYESADMELSPLVVKRKKYGRMGFPLAPFEPYLILHHGPPPQTIKWTGHGHGAFSRYP